MVSISSYYAWECVHRNEKMCLAGTLNGAPSTVNGQLIFRTRARCTAQTRIVLRTGRCLWAYLLVLITGSWNAVVIDELKNTHEEPRQGALHQQARPFSTTALQNEAQPKEDNVAASDTTEGIELIGGKTLTACMTMAGKNLIPLRLGERHKVRKTLRMGTNRLQPSAFGLSKTEASTFQDAISKYTRRVLRRNKNAGILL